MKLDNTLTDKVIADLYDANSTPWRGPSGEIVTGEQVARHLEAAIAHMQRFGWDPQVFAPHSGHGFDDAMQEVMLDGRGTLDSGHVAVRLCEAYLRVKVSSGAFVALSRWATHEQRTLDDIGHMVKVVAEIAREA